MINNTYEVPQKVQEAAQKGLELHQQYGCGGTEVGLKMAKRLARGGSPVEEDVRHVARYFPRHSVDNLGEDGSDGKAPSNGHIAWMLWGGEVGEKSSEGLVKKMEEKS